MDKKGNIVFAIDCDEVLRPVLGNMVELYNKEFDTNVQYSDVKDFDVEVSFPLVRKTLGKSPLDWFFQEHEEDVFMSKGPFIEPRVFNALRRLGRVVIVTSQRSHSNRVKTMEWLDKHGIEYDDIFFTNDKSQIVCDYLVDDNPDNFKNTHASVCVLIDAPYSVNKTNEEVFEIIGRDNVILMREKNLSDFCMRRIASARGISHNKFSALCNALEDAIPDYNDTLPHVLLNDLLEHFDCTEKIPGLIVNQHILLTHGTLVLFRDMPTINQMPCVQFIINDNTKSVLISDKSGAKSYPINNKFQLKDAIEAILEFCW